MADNQIVADEVAPQDEIVADEVTPQDEIVADEVTPQYEVVAEEVTPLSSSSLPDDEIKLKHLDFVQVAAVYFSSCFLTLYEFAKDNAGPLKLGVDNIEVSVQTVLAPLYDKFHVVPFKLLLFVDRKVDDVFFDVETYVPSLVKQVSSQALTVATEMHRAGVLDTTKSITRNVLDKYEPVAEHYAGTMWRLLNQVPLFPQVAQLVIPTAFYWSEKYNDAVRYAGDREYYVAEYLPMIPIEKISDILEQAQ